MTFDKLREILLEGFVYAEKRLKKIQDNPESFYPAEYPTEYESYWHGKLATLTEILKLIP